MSAPAAFTATYSDLRLIKGRKVLQVIFEVPLEHSNQVLDALGGMPNPASEIWCAIARLKVPKEVMPDSTGSISAGSTARRDKAEPRSQEVTNETPASGANKKSWDEITPAQQAGILCSEPSFQKFMEITFGTFPPGGCAEKVRIECHVKSRSDILPGTRAGQLWNEMVSDYRAWMREAEVVPA